MRIEQVYAAVWGIYLFFLAVWDVRRQTLSRWMLGAALLLTALGLFLPGLLWRERGMGAGIGILFCAVSFISREGIGWADSFLLVLLGAAFGRDGLLLMLCVALALVMATAIVLFVLHKVGRKDTLPFLPFLFAGFAFYSLI